MPESAPMKMPNEDFEAIKASLAAVIIHSRILAGYKAKYLELEEFCTAEQLAEIESAMNELAEVSKLAEEAGL